MPLTVYPTGMFAFFKASFAIFCVEAKFLNTKPSVLPPANCFKTSNISGVKIPALYTAGLSSTVPFIIASFMSN